MATFTGDAASGKLTLDLNPAEPPPEYVAETEAAIADSERAGMQIA